ncbi:MAG TPA: hypothetical protein VGC40_10185 [Paenirhodobacter sp.]
MASIPGFYVLNVPPRRFRLKISPQRTTVGSPISIIATAKTGYNITAITATLNGESVNLIGSGLTSPAVRSYVPTEAGAIIVTMIGTDPNGGSVTATRSVSVADPNAWIVNVTAGGVTVAKSPVVSAPTIVAVGDGSATVAA